LKRSPVPYDIAAPHEKGKIVGPTFTLEARTVSRLLDSVAIALQPEMK
jgi:hypothetical protein